MKSMTNLISSLGELRLVLEQITHEEEEEVIEVVDPNPEYVEVRDGSLDAPPDLFIGKNSSQEWVGLDMQNKKWSTTSVQQTTKTGKNKYGVYYKDMPSTVVNEETFGEHQGDLNWLLLNYDPSNNPTIKNALDYYVVLAANHRLKKYRQYPNGITKIQADTVEIA